MNGVESFKTCVVSTAHLPETLARYMEDHERASNADPFSNLIFETLTYGYRLWADMEENNIPEDIKPLILAAKKAGFKWVEFDCDADKLEGYRTWEW